MKKIYLMLFALLVGFFISSLIRARKAEAATEINVRGTVFINKPHELTLANSRKGDCYGVHLATGKANAIVWTPQSNRASDCRLGSSFLQEFFWGSILYSDRLSDDLKLKFFTIKEVGTYTLKVYKFNLIGKMLILCYPAICDSYSIILDAKSEESSSSPTPTPTSLPALPTPTPTQSPGDGKQRGEACSSNSECGVNLICASNIGGGTDSINKPRCIELDTKSKGDTCYGSIECIDTNFTCHFPNQDTSYGKSGACDTTEKLERGKDCSSNSDCRPGLSCDVWEADKNRKLCMAKKNLPIGQFCYDSKECSSESCKVVKIVNGIKVGECVAGLVEGVTPTIPPGCDPNDPWCPPTATPTPTKKPEGGAGGSGGSSGGGGGSSGGAGPGATPTVGPTPSLAGKVVCSPEGGVEKRFDSSKITVANKTSAEVTYEVQYNICDYKGQSLPLEPTEKSKCELLIDSKDRVLERLPAGASKTYGWGATHAALASCKHGQIDVYNVTTADGCMRPDNGQKWDGTTHDPRGLGFAVKVNPSGCAGGGGSGGATPAGGTPVPTRPVYGGGAVSSPRIYTCGPALTCRPSSNGAFQACALRCVPAE